MRLAFKIALRFLTSSKGQTALIAIGIAVGISVQIFIGSLIEGLQVSLLDATIGSASQITVNPEEKNTPIDDLQDIENWLTETYDEITAITPTLTQGGFLKIGDNTEQVVFRGFDLNKANEIYKFDAAITEGTYTLKENEVILGVDLAKNNNLKIGETYDIITPEGTISALKIVGFFDLKVASINQSWIIGSIDLARDIFDFSSSQGTAIELQISEPFDADLLTEEMTLTSTQKDVKFDNWKVQNEQLLSGLNGQSTSSLMIQVFVVISVVLGIASVLAITVLQKSRQLGILKAMGLNDRTSSFVFLFQGIILGILGGILGIIFGLGLLWSFTKFALNPDGTPVVPIFVNYGFIGLSGLIAVAASTLASIIPAQKSKKLSPIEVIKNG
ncbi:ABC transporter permease [Fusibacter tunisiensis]|uniref:Lipoprotein-releasing system permease protein n=1 Tax=Fusibacter tunisiensis TaxID=1008308 RepID=A0ABS2MRS0_9FIRM|nr:FtsX-like permease family protein [Fusibacter tunisiensis]MBM7562123.1 lipoprotein-releasing system permease protein [Fusibacter tunisiensis]